VNYMRTDHIREEWTTTGCIRTQGVRRWNKKDG